MKSKLFVLFSFLLIIFSLSACTTQVPVIPSDYDYDADTASQDPVTGEEDEGASTGSENAASQLDAAPVGIQVPLNGKGFETRMENGNYVIDSESGNLAWFYANNRENIVSIDYDNLSNQLTIRSFVAAANQTAEMVSSVAIDEAVEFCGKLHFLITYTTLENGENVMMLESRGSDYVVADGIDYRIWLIRVAGDGTLDRFYEDSLLGSGDEDITADIRRSFNAASGYSLTKDQFEDAFYEGHLITDILEHKEIAEITARSYAFEAVDRGDFDASQSIVDQYMRIKESKRGVLDWGTGTFLSMTEGGF